MLTPNQQATLIVELRDAAYSGLSADDAFALLNSPKAVVTTKMVPSSLTLAGVMQILSAETATKLVNNPNLTDIRDKIIANDMNAVALWLGMFAKTGVLTANEVTALRAAMQQTQAVSETTYIPPRIAKPFYVNGVNVSMPNAIDRTDFDSAWSAK